MKKIESFKIGKYNLPFRGFWKTRCQNRQKSAQKPPFLGLSKWKKRKLHLQNAKMTILKKKTRFVFVNFLQRGFVFPVNWQRGGKGWKDFFEIVFLDKFRALCYYIIYIWENSAQNCPIGGVCLTHLPKTLLAEPLSARAYRRWRPTAKVICEHRRESKQKQSWAKVLILCRRKRKWETKLSHDCSV